MRALVVFESMFGNTETIAKAIADGLSTRIPVEVREVSTAPSAIDTDGVLLVVGGPTHAFGMTRPQTRQDAAKQRGAPVVSEGNGIREWLGGLRPNHPSAATAFDTRVTCPKFLTSSEYAPRIRSRLEREDDLIRDAEHRGWAREIERHQCTCRRLEQLLTDLGEPLTPPPPTTPTNPESAANPRP